MGSVKSLFAVESVDQSGYPNRIPDVILPSQFFESVGAQTFSSEQRLMLAILADAINLLGSTDSSNLRRRSNNEAWSWVFAKRITSSLSFDHVCDALGVDAESLRRRLSELVSDHGGSLLRLRLKEASRMQRPAVIRVRRSRRRTHPRS
jgi:hypothetical protein